MTKEQRVHQVAITALPIACDLLLKNGAPASSVDLLVEYKRIYFEALNDSQLLEIETDLF